MISLTLQLLYLCKERRHPLSRRLGTDVLVTTNSTCPCRDSNSITTRSYIDYYCCQQNLLQPAVCHSKECYCVFKMPTVTCHRLYYCPPVSPVPLNCVRLRSDHQHSRISSFPVMGKFIVLFTNESNSFSTYLFTTTCAIFHTIQKLLLQHVSARRECKTPHSVLKTKQPVELYSCHLKYCTIKPVMHSTKCT